MLSFDRSATKFTRADAIFRNLKEDLWLELPVFYLRVMQAAEQTGQLKMTQFPWHQRAKPVTQKKYFVSLGQIQLIDGKRTALSKNQYLSVASQTKLIEASISLAWLAGQENCTEDNLVLNGDRFNRAAARITPPGYHPGAVREIVYPSPGQYQPREVYCNLYLKLKG